MPAAFDNPAGVNLAAVHQFARAFGVSAILPLSVPAFSWSVGLLLLGVWGGYAVAVVLALFGRTPQARRMLPVIVCVAAALAIVCPPSFSKDAYAYVAFGRIGGWYRENPYLHTLAEMARRGDA